MTTKDLPLGFGFMLAQNPLAMQIFSQFSQNKQSEILQQTHSAASREEMQLLVNELVASSSAPSPNSLS